MAFSTIVAVEMHRHEDSWSAKLMRAFTTQACHLVIRVNLVEFEHCKLHLLPLMLDLLWFGVCFLLAFFGTTIESGGQKQRRFIRGARVQQAIKGSQRLTA